MMERWSGNYAAFCATVAMVAVAMLRGAHAHVAGATCWTASPMPG